MNKVEGKAAELGFNLLFRVSGAANLLSVCIMPMKNLRLWLL